MTEVLIVKISFPKWRLWTFAASTHLICAGICLRILPDNLAERMIDAICRWLVAGCTVRPIK